MIGKRGESSKLELTWLKSDHTSVEVLEWWVRLIYRGQFGLKYLCPCSHGCFDIIKGGKRHDLIDPWDLFVIFKKWHPVTLVSGNHQGEPGWTTEDKQSHPPQKKKWLSWFINLSCGFSAVGELLRWGVHAHLRSPSRHGLSKDRPALHSSSAANYCTVYLLPHVMGKTLLFFMGATYQHQNLGWTRRVVVARSRLELVLTAVCVYIMMHCAQVLGRPSKGVFIQSCWWSTSNCASFMCALLQVNVLCILILLDQVVLLDLNDKNP